METPDTGAVTTTYSGTSTTVTDQAGRKRMTDIDSMGRIRTVQEPAAATGQLAGSASYPTYYAYDARGDLRSVTQGAQVRTFVYDERGRLTWAKMPEQAATISDGVGGTWSQHNTYDRASNILSHQEARQGA